MSELIECKYGKHTTDKSNFTPGGLNSVYTICKECVRIRTKKYRQNNREKVNASKREYDRIWHANKREEKDLQRLEELCA